MKKNLVKVVFVGLMMTFALGLVGCATMCVGKVSDDFKSQIVKGQTTKMDVENVLGLPDQHHPSGKGQTKSSYIEVKVTESIGYAKQENTEFWIIFDSNDVVLDFGSKPTDMTKGFGAR